MRLVQRLCGLVLVVVMTVLALSGCAFYGNTPLEPILASSDSAVGAASDNTVIALISTEKRLEEDFGQNVWSAISRYAGENALGFATYKTEAESAEAAQSTLELAVTSGAQLVVAMDETVSAAMLETADRYPQTEFVLLDIDSQPVQGNVVTVSYSAVQAGWMAGYVAMQEQRGVLGLVSLPDDESQPYSLGFMLGADAAAEELGMPEASTPLYQVVLDDAEADEDESEEGEGGGSDGTPSSVVAQSGPLQDGPEQHVDPVASLLDWGAGIVFAADETMQQQVLEIVQKYSAKMIGIGAWAEGIRTAGMLASIEYDAAPLVYELLGEWSAGTLPVGTMVLGDVVDGSVSLVPETDRFEQMSNWQLERVASKFDDGTLARQLEQLVKTDDQGQWPTPEELELEYLFVVPPGPVTPMSTEDVVSSDSALDVSQPASDVSGDA